MLLGVIADDFTGATDIAGFLVENGMRTVQLNGVPTGDTQVDADAVVISLKSRSCPANQAVSQSLAALVTGSGLPTVLLQILLDIRQYRAGQHWASNRCPAGRTE
jgi:hypothetical protein